MAMDRLAGSSGEYPRSRRRLPCGSVSTASTRYPAAAARPAIPAVRLVLPTPPLPLAIATTRLTCHTLHIHGSAHPDGTSVLAGGATPTEPVPTQRARQVRRHTRRPLYITVHPRR